MAHNGDQQQQQVAAAPVINSSIPFPTPLELSGNLRENISNWKDAFETYLIASGVEMLDERVKVATFKSALGAEARKIFNLWPLQEEQRNTVAACMESLSRNMIPQRNVKLARYEFNQCHQEAGDDANLPETMAHFINRARELVKDCNYGDMEDELLRDKIITGIRSLTLKKHFIEQPDLTAAQVIQQCQTEEATREEMMRNQWIEAQEHSVNKVTGTKPKQKQCSFCGKGFHSDLSDCPARGATCHYCGMKNHYAIVCKKKEEDKRSGTSGERKRKKINTVENANQRSGSEDSESDEESVTMFQYLYEVKQSEDDTLLKASITFIDDNKHRRKVRCVLDTGASCNVIGRSNVMNLLGTKQLRLDGNKAVLKGFGGGRRKSLGRAVVDCVHNGTPYKMVFHVVDFDQPPILSLRTCLKLKLIQVCLPLSDQQSTSKQAKKRFPDVLSRAAVSGNDDTSEEAYETINAVEYLSITDKGVKQIQKASKKSQQDSRKLQRRADCSSDQRLLNRNTRNDMPTAGSKYIPEFEGVKEKIVKCRQQAKSYYDRKAQRLTDVKFRQPAFSVKPTDKELNRGTVRSAAVSVGDQWYIRDNTCVKSAHLETASGLLEPVCSLDKSKLRVMEDQRVSGAE